MNRDVTHYFVEPPDLEQWMSLPFILGVMTEHFMLG
jgi:hypothetical protein